MEENKPDITTSQSTIKNAIVLAIFALVSISATAITWVATRDRIQTEKEEALLRAIDNLIPKEAFANDPYTDCIIVTNDQFIGTEELVVGNDDPYTDCIIVTNDQFLGTDESRQVWRLRDGDNAPVGLIISSVAPNGYTGAIEFIAGYRNYPDTEDRLAGVRVTSHQETPGLGDKIDERKSDWIYTLSDHIVSEIKEPKWLVKNDGGDFDAFTGATITPRALLAAITKTTEYYRLNKETLFTAPSNCSVTVEDAND